MSIVQLSTRTNRSRPGDAAFADVTAEYEARFGGPRFTAVLGGSPVDWLGLRLAARYGNGGGLYQNELLGAKEGGPEEGVFRLSAVVEASRSARIDLKHEHGTYGFDGDLGEQVGPSELHRLLLSGLPAADDGRPDWRRSMDRELYRAACGAFGGRTEPGLSQEQDDLSVNAGLDVGENRLTAVLGHSRLSYDSHVDTDAGPPRSSSAASRRRSTRRASSCCGRRPPGARWTTSSVATLTAASWTTSSPTSSSRRGGWLRSRGAVQAGTGSG